eukprot:scaffold14425_cov133-Isochrysis_galbana.AAC.5
MPKLRPRLQESAVHPPLAYEYFYFGAKAHHNRKQERTQAQDTQAMCTQIASQTPKRYRHTTLYNSSIDHTPTPPPRQQCCLQLISMAVHQ